MMQTLSRPPAARVVETIGHLADPVRPAVFAAVAMSTLVTVCGLARARQPQYTIVDIGVVNVGDTASQAFRISPGGIATGRSVAAAGAAAFTWTRGGGIVGLPSLASPSRPYSVGNGANDSGQVVGVGSTTLSGSSPLPLIWQSGVVSQLQLPAGQTLGRAQDINSAGLLVGSVNAGSAQRGAMFSTGGAGTVITQTTATGCFMNVAFAINDAGLIGGTGIDPNNAARNVGVVVLPGSGAMVDIGALPGMNGALIFDVSNAGHATGSSMLNQGSGVPFVWTAGSGMVAVPLPTGTSQGSGRGVNSNGWVVGTASSAFAIPFLYNGVSSFRLGDLIPAGTGWDLLTNTSSSALGISEAGIIVGTGLFNGAIHAYAMIPVPACYPNCDASTISPVLNVLDFSCFLNKFAAGDSYANCDGSTTPPVLNVQDFSCFLNSFAAGCR